MIKENIKYLFCSCGDCADFVTVSFCPGEVAVSGEAGVSWDEVTGREDALLKVEDAGEDRVSGDAVCVSGEQFYSKTTISICKVPSITFLFSFQKTSKFIFP